MRSDGHHCHARGCLVPTKPEMLMCRRHWFMVPPHLRARVWATYRAGQCDDKKPSREWYTVADAAIAAVAAREVSPSEKGLMGEVQTMTIGSLFTGIGGLDLGLEACGCGPVIWQCDSDPLARAVLASHWPAARIYDDIRSIDAHTDRTDIICGGFPCQPTSFAGHRRAQKDPRWLWPFFAAVVARLRPRIVFLENVPGLQTAGLRDVLADLADLGFDAQWDRFWAAEAGSPHLRERVFVLAHAGRIGREEVGELGIPQLQRRTRAARRGNPYRCGSADARFPACRSHYVDERNGPEPAVRSGAHGLPARVAHRLGGNACSPQQVALAWRTLLLRVSENAKAK